MSSDFELRGADQFLALSKALKDTRPALRKELNKGIRDATKPLLPKAAEALAAGLPPRLKARGRRVKQRVQVKTGNDPGVTIAVPYGRRGAGGLGATNARLLNTRGQLRHPLYGNRERWYTTDAPAALGWFDQTYSSQAPSVLPGIERAVERVVEKIVREAR